VEAALVARSGRWPGPAEIAEAIPGLPVPTFGGTASMRPDHIPDMTMYGGLTTHKSNYDFVTLATVETMSTKEIQKPPQADFWQWLEAAKFSV
jgi:branched-chain amino acid transport system substrate-binding protein